jgi:calcineurin-like phosphoesterase family protein
MGGNIMGKVFVISDTHFNHANIIKYCNRPFNSVEEMNETLIKKWNDTVQPEDTVFFLGDFCLGKREDIIHFCQALNGHKILIMGNHDKATKTVFTEAGFETVYKKPTIFKFDEYDTPIRFSHAPYYDEVEDNYPNVYGHVHDQPVNDATHYCVCVELHDYKPIPLEKIIEYFKSQ